MIEPTFYDNYFEGELNDDYNFFIEQMIKSMEEKYSSFDKEVIISKHSNAFEHESDNCFEEQNG